MIDKANGAKMIKKRIFESGRSLVEMLGVLAVIGVLSVGAIAGYRRAIDSQKASATIAELNQYALLASQQALQKRADLDLSELGNVTNQGYPVSAVVQADPTFFEIFLKDVPASICERILDSDWSVPLVMFANNYAYTGETGICDNGEDELADMAFQFKEDLNPDAMPMGGCVQDSDCKGSCVKCENQQCVSTCVGSERCATDQETGEKVCCPSEKRAGPMCCSSTQNGWCCNASSQCCPWHKPLVDKNGKCYSCDNEAGVDVTGVTENCSVCSEREIAQNYSTKLCVLKCPKDKPLKGSNGKCYNCNDETVVTMYTPFNYCSTVCPNRTAGGASGMYCSISCSPDAFYDIEGKCHSCDEESAISVPNEAECSKCSQRTLYGQFCVLDCPQNMIRNAEGICVSCTVQDPIKMTSQASDNYCETVCPNRVAAGGLYSGRCIIPCQKGEFTGASGVCYDCNTTSSIEASTRQNDCELCSNRTIINGICILECPENYIRATDGNCYNCEQEEPILVTQLGECSKYCPNRIKAGSWGNYCSLPCDKNQFMNNIGKCVSCSYEQNVHMGDYSPTYDCSKCADTRNQYNNMCVPKCPTETPLRGADNKCYACDDPTRVPVTNMTDACYECPDERKLDGDYCVLK